MIIRRLDDLPPFASGDRARLRELLHPGKMARADFRYSLAHAEVAPGRRTLAHRLRSSEVYYILEGRGTMHVDAESAEVRPGDAVVIPPDSVQFIENPGPAPLAFLCIVDPAWRGDDEEVLE